VMAGTELFDVWRQRPQRRQQIGQTSVRRL
jgi:hypothetical protein